MPSTILQTPIIPPSTLEPLVLHGYVHWSVRRLVKIGGADPTFGG